MNREEISQNEILKCRSEMAKGLMANKIDRSYLITDVYETIAVDSYQRKIPSEVLECYKFPSMSWIQTKQGYKKWEESLHLCLDSSRSYKRNQKSVNLALRRKQATLVY